MPRGGRAQIPGEPQQVPPRENAVKSMAERQGDSAQESSQAASPPPS